MNLDRRNLLLNDKEIEKLSSAKIALFGLGGVGGYVLDNLVRNGINDFILVDGDKFEETNLNRQLLSNIDNIGKRKVDVASKYVLSLNNKAKIKTHDLFVNESNVGSLGLKGYYIIDAIDDINGKLALIKYAKENNLNIVSMMGAGNRLNASFISSDIFKTENDPLSKKMRKLLKENDIDKLGVVYSKDDIIKTDSRTVGSISYVVSNAANKLVEAVIKELIK